MASEMLLLMSELKYFTQDSCCFVIIINVSEI